MKPASPLTVFTLLRSEHLFNIDFAFYNLSHHSFCRHFHDHYVVEFVVNGADKFYCDGKTYTAENNQLVLINPGEVHTGSTIKDTPLHYFSMYPDKNNLRQIADSLHIHLPWDFRFAKTVLDYPTLIIKFGKLFDSLRSDEDLLQQEEYFFDCMRALLCQRPRESNDSYKYDARVQVLIDYIRTHFKEDLSLQDMAHLARLNPFHLSRLFKKTTGVSPYEYLVITRTEHARQLLRKGYRVQQAAIDSGFYDTSHFNRSLRKITGTSPRSFLSSKKSISYNF